MQNSAVKIEIDTKTKSPSLDGLSSGEVLQIRKEYGENKLPAQKSTSIWNILLSQFKSPLIYIILVAALVSLVAREYGDFWIIMAVVIIDVILGFVQEYQAEKSFTALKSLLRPTTTVIRDDMRCEIEVWELVPGDLVVLSNGEKVPGDGELVESIKISLDEAILTGESEPISKNAEAGQNQVYMGTTVLTGHGLMRVVETGLNTELGQIAASLQEDDDDETPLQVRLKNFSKTLTWIVVGFTLAILITGMVMGNGFLSMMRMSIILAIAAVPEGLLIAVTVILVIGMRKILRRNGLVKRLLAVETLGSVTTICTDKTGTLTEGRMRVTRVELSNPERSFETMALCNNLEGPVDIALWQYASAQLPNGPQELVDRSERLAEELFTSDTKYMITATQTNGDFYNYLKGAPEIIIEMCSLSPEERSRVLMKADEWAGEGLRLLGLACRPMGSLEEHSGYEWVGLIGMEDPIREGVQHAIQVARRAGIEVKMITGDYRRTAERIARNIGLAEDGDLILEGSELQNLSEEQLRERVKETKVFSRIRPQEKLRIISALQANGQITAMIGDGVNDAPALKRSNIGVVVGSATDVAKETADLILLDNNFRTIVAAIEEGRIIFQNIRKVVAYTLSNSFAEVLTIFIAMMLRWPAPLIVAQILWIHLICDGPSDIVLGFEPKERGIMEEKPKSLKEPILNRLGLSLIGIISIASSITALLLFNHYNKLHGNAVEGRSIVFASFAINSIIYIFAYRSLRQPIFRMAPLSKNIPLVLAVFSGLLMAVGAFVFPFTRKLLDIVPLTWQEWFMVGGIALGLLVIVEIGKWISNILHGDN